MIEGLRSLGGRWFPNRRILLCNGTSGSGGRIYTIALPGWLQVATLVVALGGIGGIGSLVGGYLHAQRVLHHQSAALVDLAQHAAAAAGAADDELRQRLAEATQRADSLSQRVAATSAQLDAAQRQLATINQRLTAATGERDTLKANLGQAQAKAKALEGARADLQRQLQTAAVNGTDVRQAEMEQTALRNRLKERDNELLAAGARSQQLKSAVDAMDRKMLQMAFERDRLRAQVGQTAAAPAVAATPAAIPAAAPPADDVWPDDQEIAPVPAKPAAAKDETSDAAPEAAPAARLAARGGTSTGELERLIASTGVNIDKLLGSLSLVGGQGGPYVALSSVKRAPADEGKRIAELQRLVKTLPLGAPLAQYQLESGFGPRIDPINGRPSFHPGLDLAAAYRSPVIATAPGIVSFTGTKDAYGRVVEINHGHGIVTRYAHLHRILVALGQRVAAKQEIAELGSTGRSTGPHVHYEILIDGIAVDPAKFMKVGKSVVEVSVKK